MVLFPAICPPFQLAVESSEEIELDLGFADFSVILEEMGHPEASGKF